VLRRGGTQLDAVGLSNDGKWTCFFNALLQFLASSVFRDGDIGGKYEEPLIQALQLAQRLMTCTPIADDSQQQLQRQNLRASLCAINTGERVDRLFIPGTIHTGQLVDRFRVMFPAMFCDQQQDPRELLGMMMGSPEVDGTLLDTTFRFDQEVRVTCCCCGRVSTTVSSVHSMPVPMVANIEEDIYNQSTDLQSLAKSNWASEDELVGWKCPGGCPDACIAMKTLRLASRPRRLHISLLRYSQDDKVRHKTTIHVVMFFGICCLVV
jgi:ubiquitin C-terminal hydrolase